MDAGDPYMAPSGNREPTGSEPATDAPRPRGDSDRRDNLSESHLEDSHHTAQRNISSTGSGQWQWSFRVNGTGVQNMTVTIDFEPRDGQNHWTTAFGEYELVAPNGTLVWASNAPDVGPPNGYGHGTTIPRDEVRGGVWDFVFTWDGPTDVRLTINVLVERGGST